MNRIESRTMTVSGAVLAGWLLLGMTQTPTAAAPRATTLTASSNQARDIVTQLGDWFERGDDRVSFTVMPQGLGVRVDAARIGVRLPLDSTGYFEVREPRAGLSVTARLLGATPARAEPVDGSVVYRRGFGEAHVVHRPSRWGTEDFVVFPRRSGEPVLRYEMVLGRRVAGLRLVENVLELLDAGGAPRLRVARPYLVAADGSRREARLSVEGCAVQTSPAPPWGTQIVAPGARRCELVVRWNDARLSYPIAVDPGWESAGQMSTYRIGHSVTRMADGRILAAGSSSETTGVTAEVYDPTSNTWANVANMASPRGAGPVLLSLDTGRVLVAGGGYYDLNAGAMVGLSTAELFDPATGTWSATGAMSAGRAYPAGVQLRDGSVLVTGGRDGQYPQVTGEVYDPASGSWSAAGTLVGRAGHHMLRLDDGRVLVVGGSTDGASELYDPATRVFAQTAYMSEGRVFPSAALLADGRVLVAGGAYLTTSLSTSELWDPSSNSWSAGPDLAEPRVSGFTASLPGGSVMVGGGTLSYPSSDSVATVETYDPGTNRWSPAPEMAVARSSPKAAVLESGEVVVTGEDREAEVFRSGGVGDPCTGCVDCASGVCAGGTCRDAPAELGTACACNSACSSGFCVAGLCCDTACDEACQACTAAEKHAGSDGECGLIAPGSDPGGACAASCDNRGQCGEQGCVCLPASGTVCDGDGVLDSSGTRVECAPYTCQNGVCLTSCSGSSECAGGFDCAAGSCAPPTGAMASDDDSGCGCSTPGGSPPSPWVLVSVGLGLVLLRRRS